MLLLISFKIRVKGSVLTTSIFQIHSIRWEITKLKKYLRNQRSNLLIAISQVFI